MVKTPKNDGKAWTAGDVKQLKQEIKQNLPTRVMGCTFSERRALSRKANALGLHEAREPTALRHEEVEGALAG